MEGNDMSQITEPKFEIGIWEDSLGFQVNVWEHGDDDQVWCEEYFRTYNVEEGGTYDKPSLNLYASKSSACKAAKEYAAETKDELSGAAQVIITDETWDDPAFYDEVADL
jgi:hypothetical protein